HPVLERLLPRIVPARRQRRRLAGHGTRLALDRGGLRAERAHRLVHGREGTAGPRAEPAEELPQVAGECLVDALQLVDGGPAEVQQLQPEQAAQLADRVDVVVDAKVDPAVVAAAVAGAL